MQNFKDYKRVIATKEMSAGNESVGTMWLETKSFDKHTSINLIMEWAYNCHGKLIISVDESDAISEF
tara:strand:+ start:2308 stop:2508 length:201 start_codon:yes stop_codon:yes gene_type:complete